MQKTKRKWKNGEVARIGSDLHKKRRVPSIDGQASMILDWFVIQAGFDLGRPIGVESKRILIGGRDEAVPDDQSLLSKSSGLSHIGRWLTIRRSKTGTLSSRCCCRGRIGCTRVGWHRCRSFRSSSRISRLVIFDQHLQ